jgi:HPt (histidine-containing phosphotransfer) domain-containing protein
MISPAPEARLPLVDTEAVRELESQLDDPAAAHSFLRNYVSIWEDRYARLAAAVLRGDQDASLDAVLSVKITSVMTGAARLAQLAVELEALIRLPDMEAAEAHLAAIEECGQQTITVLQRYS